MISMNPHTSFGSKSLPCLPNELHSLIFSFCLGLTGNYNEYVAQLFVLEAVSRRCKSIVDTTPEFWTELCFVASDESEHRLTSERAAAIRSQIDRHISATFSRSGNTRPLTLSLEARNDIGPWCLQEPYASRMSDLSLTLGLEALMANLGLDSPNKWPTLKRLELNTHGSHAGKNGSKALFDLLRYDDSSASESELPMIGRSADTLEQRMPMLSRLSLSVLSLPMWCPIFQEPSPHITTLEIRTLSNADSILQMLSTFTALEQCTLACGLVYQASEESLIQGGVDGILSHPGPATITTTPLSNDGLTLSRLKELKIHAPADDVTKLLQTLKCPTLESCSIQVQHPGGVVNFVALRNFLQVVTPSSSNLESSDLPPPTLRTLELRDLYLTGFDYDVLLFGLPHLRHLTIHDKYLSPSTFLSEARGLECHLQVVLGNPSAIRFLPRLQTLTLHCMMPDVEDELDVYEETFEDVMYLIRERSPSAFVQYHGHHDWRNGCEKCEVFDDIRITQHDAAAAEATRYL